MGRAINKTVMIVELIKVASFIIIVVITKFQFPASLDNFSVCSHVSIMLDTISVVYYPAILIDAVMLCLLRREGLSVFIRRHQLDPLT